MFTQEELETFDVDGLRRLCKYFNIEFTNKTSKKKLVQIIAEYIETHKSDKEENLPPMSAMVRRIHDRLKEK